MSFLRQLLPNSYDPGSVRTHRDMLSRTEAISAALAHAGLLTTDITDVIDDFHHRLLAALDSSERPAEVRAATDGILSRSIEE